MKKEFLSEEEFQQLVESFKKDRDEDLSFKWNLIGLRDGHEWVPKAGFAETDKYVSFIDSILNEDKYDQYSRIWDLVSDYEKDPNFTDVAWGAFWKGFYEGVTNYWNKIIKQF